MGLKGQDQLYCLSGGMFGMRLILVQSVVKADKRRHTFPIGWKWKMAVFIKCFYVHSTTSGLQGLSQRAYSASMFLSFASFLLLLLLQ